MTPVAIKQKKKNKTAIYQHLLRNFPHFFTSFSAKINETNFIILCKKRQELT